MSRPSHGSDRQRTGRSLSQLLEKCDELQARSARIQARASRTTGLIASTSQRSDSLIVQVHQTERSVVEARVRILRSFLDRQSECLFAIEQLLEALRHTADRRDRNRLRSRIVNGFREVEVLAAKFQGVVGQSLGDVDRALEMAEPRPEEGIGVGSPQPNDCGAPGQN